MLKRNLARIAGIIILVCLSYGIGLLHGRSGLNLVVESARVASDMSGSWQRSPSGSVTAVIRHFKHHAWYVLVGAYANPRPIVEPILGSRIARNIRGLGDERDWVLYTVLDNGTVLPAVDIHPPQYGKGTMFSRDVVVVKNSAVGPEIYQRIEIAPGMAQ